MDSLSLSAETSENLAERLAGYWQVVATTSGMPPEQIARQALLAPARCMLKDAGLVGAVGEKSADTAVTDLRLVGREKHLVDREEHLVHRAFTILGEVSGRLRSRYRL